MKIEPLTPPDSFHLSAAEGWLELGSHQEALSELKLVSSELSDHPHVLEMLWSIYAQSCQWNLALTTARRLTETSPENAIGWVHLAFSLHELKQTEAAHNALLPVVGKFPRDGLMRYNLACYACQLGDLFSAEEWLARAMKIMGKKTVLLMAESDPDLTPLRERLSQI